MLILTRHVGETIVINRDIRVTVLATKGGQLRLGIEAPPEVEVHREEIYNRIYGLDNPESNKSVSKEHFEQ